MSRSSIASLNVLQRILGPATRRTRLNEPRQVSCRGPMRSAGLRDYLHVDRSSQNQRCAAAKTYTAAFWRLTGAYQSDSDKRRVPPIREMA
jgi:hypothetical protein